MKKIIFISLLLLLVSCGTYKKKTGTHSISREVGTRTREIPGDTVIHVRDTVYKDKVIVQRTKYLNLTTRYDNKGNIEKVDCVQKPVKETEEYVKEKEETRKQIEKERKPAYNPEKLMFYGFLGLFALIISNKIIDKTIG